MDIGGVLIAVVGWIVGAVIGFTILYWVIRQAITHALREHTLNAVWAVTVKQPTATTQTPATD